MSIFTGIWVPLITPFFNGQVDHAALGKLTRYYVEAGVSGLVALGTTGEAAALDQLEQRAVVATVLQAAAGLPVIVGLSGNHSGQLHENLQYFGASDIAGFLIPAPCYVRPSQQGLIDHFSSLADASPVPLVLYDIPYRSGVQIELSTLLTLAAHPQIQAVKDCAGSVATTQALIADGRLQVLSGEDINVLNNLCMGGSGAIAASVHVKPQRFVALYRAVSEQRLHDARAIFHELAPLIRLLFAEASPGPVKAVLAQQGWIKDELRVPMTVASPALRAQLLQLAEG
ncbi:4-hydroxy-tetrahydrodipicolinate synthase [Collimonas arenae]|uniref:4-hydroxy-tetrahydrodipicolinate synthase n=1 Tax=Collimonas arenae TaxID=279058 RepID=A0A0A1F8A2_9BURK|nr:4-hydroxy-tetrahydrodipicolinate synthase [Collimonas arenae]AIY40010.1 4-hydroxy-tetrahydrodipicolinate synthase [Collimonas arenae]